MDIHLHQESVVNERTGEVEAPSEYVENLRALERQIQRSDDDILQLKEHLKEAKSEREQAVAKLRESIREGKVLPLLEQDGEIDAEGDDE